MTASQAKPAPLLAIWANPIFIRFARSRLRLGSALPWAVVILIGAAFAFSLIYILDTSNGTSPAHAANDAFFPLYILQAFLLLFSGTGSVANGINRECADGMTQYMRLVPMKPSAKIAGYLCGLPVREWALAALTLPFSLFCLLRGTIGFDRALTLYGVLALIAIGYHLAGCVVGTVVKNPRFASGTTRALILVLYFALPAFSNVGLTFFEYLTLRPVVIEVFAGVEGMPIFGNLFQQQSAVPEAQFFDRSFTRVQFTALVQLTLITTLFLILHRRWRDAESHLLGKGYAALLVGWIFLALLGNTIPAMADPGFYPKMYPSHRPEVNVKNAFVLASLMGVGALVLATCAIAVVSPSADQYRAGLRRARKLGLRRIPLRADAAGAGGWALVLALLAAAFWSAFNRHLFASKAIHEVPGHHLGMLGVGAPLALAVLILCFHGVYERFGRKASLMFVLFAWIVPLLLALLLTAARATDLAVLGAAFSALAAPFYLLTLPLLESDTLGMTTRLMRFGATLSTLAHVALLLALALSLHRHKRRIRRFVREEGAPVDG